MNCKNCQKPVFQAIEGELICEDCWIKGQQSDESRELDNQIQWFSTHCCCCEKEFKPQELKDGACKACDDEQAEWLKNNEPEKPFGVPSSEWYEEQADQDYFQRVLRGEE